MQNPKVFLRVGSMQEEQKMREDTKQLKVEDELMPPQELMHHVGSGDFKAIGNAILRHLVNLGELKPNGRVLDVGCGCGRVALPLTKYLGGEGSYEGFDIHTPSITWCQQNISCQHPNFKFQVSDIYSKRYNPQGITPASDYKFPYQNESFDVVFLTSIFTHMLPNDLEHYLSEIARVLKVGGRCLITIFFLNEESLSLMRMSSNNLVEQGYQLSFKYKYGYYAVQDANLPEAAVAYNENFIQNLYEKFRLSIIQPIHYGSWCGRQQSSTGQDLIVAVKSESEKKKSEVTKSTISEPLPLVSICIPTYNGEEFITEALESVLAQTYTCIEVIISDDASNDNTVQIVSSFQKRFLNKNFFLFQHERYGIAQNWNFCIAQSRGKYIKFLFQDDLLEPECIAEMVDLAEQDAEIGLVFCPRELILTKTAEHDPGCMDVYRYAKNVHKAWSEMRSVNVGSELLAHSDFFKSPLNKIGEPSNVLLRKQIFEKVGLFDSDLYQTLDMDMWFRIMCQCKIGFVDKFLVKFRIHPKQASYTNLGLINALDNHILRAKMLYSPSYSIANQQIQQQFGKEVRNLMKAELEQLFAIIQQMQIDNEQLQQQVQQAQSELNHSQEHLGQLRTQQLRSRKNDLQNNLLYSFLVCEAWYAHQNYNLSTMAKYLRKSLQYTHFSLTETILNWLETFTAFSEEKGIKFDTYVLSNSKEWQQLISDIINMGENINF